MNQSTRGPVRIEKILVGTWAGGVFVSTEERFETREMTIGWVRMSMSSYEWRWDGDKRLFLGTDFGNSNDYYGFLKSIDDPNGRKIAVEMKLGQGDRLALVQIARVVDIPARLLGKNEYGSVEYAGLGWSRDRQLFTGTEEELDRIARWKTDPKDWKPGDWAPEEHRLQNVDAVEEMDVWSSAWTDEQNAQARAEFVKRAREGIS